MAGTSPVAVSGAGGECHHASLGLVDENLSSKFIPTHATLPSESHCADRWHFVYRGGATSFARNPTTSAGLSPPGFNICESMIPSQSNQTAMSVSAKPPTISVVIPAYNAGRYICAAIDSVLAQTLPPQEIIVIDDGSTDDTGERLLVYGQRIRYFFQKNQGIGAARNIGTSRANGDWIALLDADDIWYPRKLEYQCAVIARNPDVALVGTAAILIDRDGVNVTGDPPAIGDLEAEPIPLRRLLQAPVFCPSSVVAKTSAIKATGGFSTQVQGSEDMLMWWTLAANFPVLKLHAALTGYRIHPCSISHNYLTMTVSKKRALAIALSALPPLRTQLQLRCLARARVFREASWERHCGGDHWGAIADILISIVNYPFALYSSKGIKLRLNRAKVFCRYVLSAFRRIVNR